MEPDFIEMLRDLGEPIMVCRRCWATVCASHQQKHLEWHEKLRRDVDEAEGTLD